MYAYNTRTASPLRTLRVMRIATAKHNANKAAYQQQVQQLQASYGVAATSSATRSNTAQHARSAVTGACALVHQLAQQHVTRAATLAACVAAGINPATAATQYAKYRKANPL